jgi:hypothetical protein
MMRDRERDSSRYRNSYRNTIDRDRFPKFNNEPCDYEFDDDDDVEQQQTHLSRRDRMREQREREREQPSTPQQNRHLMRYSEDRQMGTSPRYQRSGRKCLPKYQTLK